MAWIYNRRPGFADQWLGVANQRVEIGESTWWVSSIFFFLLVVFMVAVSCDCGCWWWFLAIFCVCFPLGGCFLWFLLVVSLVVVVVVG